MTIYPNIPYTVQYEVNPSSIEGQSMLLLADKVKVIPLPTYNNIYALRGLYTYPQIDNITGGMYAYYIFNNSDLPDITTIDSSSLLDKYFTNNPFKILAKGTAIFVGVEDDIVLPSRQENNEFIYPVD